MAIGQITWEKFITTNNDARGVRLKFEDLCRQLFVNEFLSKNRIHRYLHSNPNNPGIESEPILDEVNNRYIGYQAKFFDKEPDYSQIKKSAEKAVAHYKGKLDCIYLYCNKPLKTTCLSYQNIEKYLISEGITLIPITDTTILDTVRKYPILGKYYFDDHGITHEWFVEIANISAGVLGDRYNQEFNVDTEALKNLSVFLQDNSSIEYFNSKKTNLLQDIITLRRELSDYINYLIDLRNFIETIPDIDAASIPDVERWQDKVNKKFETVIEDIKNQISTVSSELEKIQDCNPEKANEYRKTLDKLKMLLDLFYRLAISKDEKALLTSKILVVTGKAGIGKTQLFAQKVFSVLSQNENALLVIAGDCLSDNNILEQVRTNLRLSFEFEDLIDILEVIGETKQRRIPIFIDALNESWRPQLWKKVLPLLYNKIIEKKYVCLAISFRTEYEKTIIPEHFFEREGIAKIEHQGFKGNSIEAAKQFLAHYGLPFTPIHIFTRNIDNPLFLTLYCKTYQGDDVGLPALYDRLLEQANVKIYAGLEEAIRNAGFDSSDNLVSTVVEAISEKIVDTGNRRLEKSEIENLSVWQSIGLAPRPFIKHLIQENILQGYEFDDKEYLYFVYDQMNDFYPAKAIISMLSSETELRRYLSEQVLGIVDGELQNWENEDLFVNVCALYAEKYKRECIDIIDSINDEDQRESFFQTYIESFEWRTTISLSLREFLDYCNKYCISPGIVWEAFITNSVKAKHMLNADALHTLLKDYPLNKRDYLWTQYINMRTTEDRVVQLVELYSSGKELQISNMEQVRLLLVVFSWMLSSSNRRLRDTTSKAMIEILKEHFEFSEYLLTLFNDVNDPYIIQRIYGIVFGACTKRTEENKDVYFSLINCVYECIFSKEFVYPDILLRDYARLIIERFIFEYPDEAIDFSLDTIKPPYRSIPIPEIDDQKYSEKNFKNGLLYILYSMRFEGIGMYGDFGRYVFQSAVKDFEVDDYKIFNYAMYFILNELEYKSELFDDYDRFVKRFSNDRHRTIKIERIGKKYQWIAMYNILARISDHYKMKKRFSTEEKCIYDGPWEPYVKDFDPTLNEHNLLAVDAPYFQSVSENIKASVEEDNRVKNEPDFNGIQWTQTKGDFFDYQKEDLMLTDDKGEHWIVLSKYADTGRNSMVHDRLIVWNWLYGYFVSNEQLAVLKEYADKKKNLVTSDITCIPETYILYNREYPWSSGSKSELQWQYKNLELRTGETHTITETVKTPDFAILDRLLAKYSGVSIENRKCEYDANESLEIPIVDKTYTREEPVTLNLGKILNTTQDMVWEEEFDGSKEETISYSHPCVELINKLGLRQRECDGYYYNEKGILVAFDTSLTKQKAGMIIRKSELDKFLRMTESILVWFVKAGKEIHGGAYKITEHSDWTGMLVYNGDFIEGEYYIVEDKG